MPADGSHQQYVRSMNHDEDGPYQINTFRLHNFTSTLSSGATLRRRHNPVNVMIQDELMKVFTNADEYV